MRLYIEPLYEPQRRGEGEYLQVNNGLIINEWIGLVIFRRYLIHSIKRPIWKDSSDILSIGWFIFHEVLVFNALS